MCKVYPVYQLWQGNPRTVEWLCCVRFGFIFHGLALGFALKTSDFRGKDHVTGIVRGHRVDTPIPKKITLILQNSFKLGRIPSVLSFN